MASLSDFQTAMRPLTRHWKQEAPETLEDWQDYYAILGHLDIQVLAAAVLKVMGNHVYPTFPKPAVILNAANDIAVPKGITGEEAWAKVVSAIREFGYNRPPIDLVPVEEQARVSIPWTFGDKRTLEIVRLFGWRRLCLEEDETLQWQFIHAYKAQAENETSEARELPAVAGVRRQLETNREMTRVSERLSALAAPTSKNGSTNGQ